eukprot:COSAG05_NODE_313_length_11620_cov_2.287301_3_plen_71_part_00
MILSSEWYYIYLYLAVPHRCPGRPIRSCMGFPEACTKFADSYSARQNPYEIFQRREGWLQSDYLIRFRPY